MTIQYVDPNLIDPNPYQPATRATFTPEQLADLESVKEIGFIHTPIARPHQVNKLDRFQMNVGWRRRAAWLLFRPGEPMPLDVQDLTDEQMFEQSAIENGQRTDLSAIEKAYFLQRAISEFGKTQAEAGKLFGLTSQGSVSNLLRMLHLPAEVQGLVAQGKLAERHARQLVGLARIKSDKATEIACKVAASGDPDETLADALVEHLEKTGGDLHETDIPVDWVPTVPMEIAGDLETPPSCARCPNYLRYEYDTYCARPACMKAKAQAWTQLELDRVSAKLGIPLTQPGEKAKMLKLNWDTVVLVKNLLKKKIKPDCLRLIADDKASSGAGDYYHRDVLGSGVVLLASTDANVLTREKSAQDKKKKGEAPESKPTAKTQTETPEQKRRRIEVEKAKEAEQAARREARSLQQRTMHDMAWLIFHTADLFAPQMTIQPVGLLQELLDIHHGHTHPPMTDWPQYREQFQALDDATENATGKDKLLLSCKLLVARELGNNVSGYRAEEQFDWPGAIEKVEGLAKDWGVKLPAGWNQPPIHQTPSNCWVCGIFTSQGHITKIDESKGWQTCADGRVTCSDACRGVKAKAKTAKQRNADYLKSINMVAATKRSRKL